MTDWFKPLHSKPEPHNILAFDIEGTGEKNGFVCGAIVGEPISSFFTDRQNMLEALVGYSFDGYWIFSHNLQYDLPILEGEAFPLADMTFTKYNILSARYIKGKRTAKLLDSANLFPRHSVAAIGAMVGYPKDDLPRFIMDKLSQGRPWSSFSQVDQELIRRYCTRDAEIVYCGVSMLQEIVLALGGQLRPTISGTAMDLYRRKFHRYPWPTVGEKTNNLARPGFYGGRVENFAVGKVENVSMYDVTSLYPFVQSLAKYPHPNHLRLDISPALTGEFWKGEGVVSASVEVPDTFIPALPHRFQSRLFFPSGRMRGTWTILELRRALGYGAKLHSVDWALWSPVTFNPFEDYVDKLFDLRRYYLSQDKGQANLVKLLLNSLYGRWGLNPEGGLYKLVDMDNDQPIEKYKGFSTYNVNGRLLAFGPIPQGRYPAFVNVLFAAQISAAGRCYLHDELVNQGENVVYCDTDSIITKGEIKTGEGLGSWRKEMDNGTADLIGPKEYTLHNAVMGTRYIAKGVPPELAKAYLETGAARFFHALGVREALRDKRRPSTWIETFKTRQEVFPKRYPVPWAEPLALSYQQTRPYQAFELPLVTLGMYLPGDYAVDYRGKVRPREAPPQQGSF